MLVTSALARRDSSALDAVDRFVADQRMLVGQLLDGQTAGREKVTASLALLDRIEKRSANARTALACGAGADGSDKLGSVPGACANASSQQSSRPAQQPQPEQTGKGGGKPEGNGGTAAPTASAAPSASASPAPAEGESEQAQEDGLLDELGRILGGLLG
jgi:hypothetical protein